MNRAGDRSGCEREAEVARALRTGSVCPELGEHVLSCAICTEAQAVAKMMLQVASLRDAEMELPAAGLVWCRAETRKREIAVRRATRPLIFMRVLAGVYAALSVTWFLCDFWRRGSLAAMSDWSFLSSETTFFAATIAVLAIVLGAGFLLRDSRRSGARVVSM